MVHPDTLDRLRLQLGAQHLHELSARATAEPFAEVGDRIGGGPSITSLLGEYERKLSPRTLRLAGGDRFPRRPLPTVPPL